MSRPPTRYQTLYRLQDVEPTPEGMFEAIVKLSGDLLEEMHADVQVINIAGSRAVWLSGEFEHEESSWCGHASMTTGLPVSHSSTQSAGLLLLGTGVHGRDSPV